MSSHRETLLATLVAALTTPPGGITKPTGLAVHRFAMLPFEEDTLPALVVYWMDCTPSKGDEFIHQPDENRLLEYQLKVRVEVRIIGNATDSVDQALDPFCQFVRQVIFFDPSLSGYAYGCKEDGIKIDTLDKGDQLFYGAAVDFTFAFFDEPFPVTGDPAIGGNLVHASYPSHPTEMTLEVQP